MPLIPPVYPFKSRLDYIRALFAPETADMTALRARLYADPNNRISVEPEEAKLLQLLIRLGGIKSIVEIGTLGGYAALSMAAALPADGKIITIEKDPARHALAAENLKNEKKITFLYGDAREVLNTLNGPFDMAFIDADKLNYGHYLDWAEKNVRLGGLIIGDNTLLFDSVWHDDPVDRVRPTARTSLRAFNERLADPERYESLMLPTAEGMTVAIKKF